MGLLLSGLLLLLIALGCSVTMWRGLSAFGFSPAERIILGVAAWLVLGYAQIMGCFLVGAVGAERASGWAWLGFGTMCAWKARRTVATLVGRSMLCSSGMVLLVGMCMVGMIKMVGGGMWYGDWGEHVERAWFWTGEISDNGFQLVFKLPSRPPGQNVLVAEAMAIFKAKKASALIAGQLMNVVFAAIAMLPMVAFARRFSSRAFRRKRSKVSVDWGLAVLVLGSGVFTAHLLFPWTRMLHAFFVVGGIYLYVLGMSKGDWRRLALGMGMVGFAMVVHYSAGPVGLAMAIHLLVIGSQRAGARAVLGGTLLAGVLFGSWIAFSVGRYGWAATAESNTSVQDSAGLTVVQQLNKAGMHMIYSLVPHPLRVPFGSFEARFRQPSAVGFWRDYGYMSYGHTLLAGMGPGVMGLGIGGVGTVLLAIRALKGRKQEACFWGWLTGVWFVVGCGVHGELATWGVAQVTMFPLQLLGLAFLAGQWSGLGKGWRLAIFAGVVLDLLLLIVPHLVALSTLPDERGWLLSGWALDNYKLARAMETPVLGDVIRGWGGMLGLVWVVSWGVMLLKVWKGVVNASRP